MRTRCGMLQKIRTGRPIEKNCTAFCANKKSMFISFHLHGAFCDLYYVLDHG